ncbi:MAG TPA: FAD-dependent oxidoreductase [Planctomycetota bacterium]|nr:FAD-dependent oxidoreductase [Planctomycetota bacterium]
MPTTEAPHTDVLVLGGGFAGTRCAQRLERLLPPDRTITLLSSENYFVFQPLLPEVVGASLDPGHVISPLRHLLRRTRVVRGEVCQINLAPSRTGSAGSVTVRAEGVDESVGFTAEHIVLALGSVVDVSRIPGMAEQSLMMKNVADALALRHAIIRRLECAVLEPEAKDRQALLTFVVVGGGFSGVETAAEMHDLVHGAMRFFPTLVSETKRVICVHSRDHILPELPTRLGDWALRLLKKRGVEFRLGERTRAASREGIYLANGELIPTRTIVCTVGNAPNPILKDLGATVEGRLQADEHLHLQGRDDVWVLGDCALVPDGHGGTAPPTAQFATRQGDVAARNIAATLRHEPLQTFRHKSLGQLATLGHLNAVAALGRLRISGFLAWWLWRTIYLLKLPRFDRKLRVVIDWTLNLFFPRDLNALDVAPTHGHATIHLEAGETLFRQGDPSAAFYVVDSGRIELTRCDEAGCVKANDLLGPGDHFGEGSLLRDGVRHTTAVAVEPTTVLSFPALEFKTLTKSFLGLRRLLESTSRRFQPAASIIPAWVPEARLQLAVSEVMSSPVVTMSEQATLEQCLTQFVARKFNCFPLVDATGRLVSLVTSTDLFAALRRDVDLQQPLQAIATANVQCLAATDTVERAVEIMRRRNVKHVVVTDADRAVVGLVSMKDILALILEASPKVAARRG